MEKTLTHTAPVRVRYAETDAMGVVYNANYLVFFEVARVELMRHYEMIYADLEKSGYLLPLIETGAKYLKSAVYDDLLDVKATCIFSYGARIEFHYEVYRGDELLTTGFSKHIFLDKKKKQPARPPKMFIEVFDKALEM